MPADMAPSPMMHKTYPRSGRSGRGATATPLSPPVGAGLGRPWRPGRPVLAGRGDLVRIGLMPHIPTQSVPRGTEDMVTRNHRSDAPDPAIFPHGLRKA